LLDASFQNVVSMDGGINAWKGLVAGGPPEAGMAYFSGNEKPEELIALAWSLEEGSRRFYDAVAHSLAERDAAELFTGLIRAEDQHKSALLGLYREATGDTAALAIPKSLFSGATPGELMEGGISVEKALAWTKGKGVNDILDMSIALESHAYDLYIKMERELADEQAKRIFKVLATEEKVHLERMVVLLEKQRFLAAP
jgi:sulfur-carrier protein adenylyltransferase/sulfurtransferase